MTPHGRHVYPTTNLFATELSEAFAWSIAMSMNNTYRHTFTARCPSDGQMIVYQLTIHTNRMLPVEHIRAATSQVGTGYHEDIADALSEILPGEQEIHAVHQGIEVETVRSGK